MNPQAEELKRRTKKFALDILALVNTFPPTDEARDIGGQLRRSATGTASNYRATCRSRSDVEFVARIGNVLEEADESGFWLEIVIEGKISTSRRAAELLSEANQLSAICAQSRITASDRFNTVTKTPRKLNEEIEHLKSEIQTLKSLMSNQSSIKS